MEKMDRQCAGKERSGKVRDAKRSVVRRQIGRMMGHGKWFETRIVTDAIWKLVMMYLYTSSRTELPVWHQRQ